jgi:hypothetical protein
VFSYINSIQFRKFALYPFRSRIWKRWLWDILSKAEEKSSGKMQKAVFVNSPYAVVFLRL